MIPDTSERRTAIFKDNKLRLLITIAGFERLGLEDELGAPWIIPSALTADQLDHLVAVIQGHRENPIMQYGDEDPVPVEEMLRRKPTVRQRAAYDDDDDLASSGDDLIVPALVGPANKKDALAELKKKRKKRRKSTTSDCDGDDDGGGISDATREARRKARLAREREVYMKVKSADFIHASDEETDEEADREFFRREEERRKDQAGKVRETMRAGLVDRTSKRKRADTGNHAEKRRRSNSPGLFMSQDERDAMATSEEEDWFARPSTARGQNKTLSVTDSSGTENDNQPLNTTSSLPRGRPWGDSADEDEATDTPISSQPGHPHEGVKDLAEADIGSRDIQGRTAKEKRIEDVVMDEESDADIPMITGGRRRGRVAVVDDDDDDDDDD